MNYQYLFAALAGLSILMTQYAHTVIAKSPTGAPEMKKWRSRAKWYPLAALVSILLIVIS